MLIKHAKQIARQWVEEHAGQIPGFDGAFFHGSINWLDDEDDLPIGSDVDVRVVLADTEPPDKLGKFVYRDVLLEVSYLARDMVRSPDTVLGQYNLAGSFHVPSIIADPSGQLTALQAAVSIDYTKRYWVRRRCGGARDKVLRYIESLDEAALFPDQVIRWLFATGITTHVLLVAGLKNPTVRKRYAAARDLLADYGYLDFHESLLALLGCDQMNRAQVESHLDTLAGVFDAASGVVATPFPFASDISDVACPIAIDGSRALIERGDHREAVFWIVATYSRCMLILHHDAPPAMVEQHDPGYRRLLADLGITAFADLQQQCTQVRDTLPRVWAVAEAIMAANPDIQD